MKKKLKIGISHGDVNGISYEVIIKTLMDNRISEICTPIIYGSPKVVAYHRKALNIEEFSPTGISSPEEARGNKPFIINCVDESIRVELGKSTESAGIDSFKALKAATDALEAGKIDALVTGPVNKQNIQHSEFNYSGHTEYLQARFQASEVMMLLVSDLMKVGLVAGHVPISKLSPMITTELVLEKLKILKKSLLVDFGIRNPHIAVLGLNPHAGDEGLLGNEEKEIINPAINQAKELGITALGPYAADGFFGAGRFRNFTAGLPVVRTSPAHGTAYELAGKNEASAVSFRNALYLAVDVARKRELYKEISADPLLPGKTKEGGKDESPEDLENTN